MRYFTAEKRKGYLPLKRFRDYVNAFGVELILFESWRDGDVYRETGRMFRLTKEGLKRI